MEMNVRRFRFSFVDDDGCDRFDWIKATTKKHVKAIIASRCKGKLEIKSLMSNTEKTHYVRPFGKIKLAPWEMLTTPTGHEMINC